MTRTELSRANNDLLRGCDLARNARNVDDCRWHLCTVTSALRRLADGGKLTTKHQMMVDSMQAAVAAKGWL